MGGNGSRHPELTLNTTHTRSKASAGASVRGAGFGVAGFEKTLSKPKGGSIQALVVPLGGLDVEDGGSFSSDGCIKDSCIKSAASVKSGSGVGIQSDIQSRNAPSLASRMMNGYQVCPATSLQVQWFYKKISAASQDLNWSGVAEEEEEEVKVKEEAPHRDSTDTTNSKRKQWKNGESSHFTSESNLWVPYEALENTVLERAYHAGVHRIDFGSGQFPAMLEERKQYNHKACKYRPMLRGTWFFLTSQGDEPHPFCPTKRVFV